MCKCCCFNFRWPFSNQSAKDPNKIEPTEEQLRQARNQTLFALKLIPDLPLNSVSTPSTASHKISHGPHHARAPSHDSLQHTRQPSRGSLVRGSPICQSVSALHSRQVSLELLKGSPILPRKSVTFHPSIEQGDEEAHDLLPKTQENFPSPLVEEISMEPLSLPQAPLIERQPAENSKTFPTPDNATTSILQMFSSSNGQEPADTKLTSSTSNKFPKS